MSLRMSIGRIAAKMMNKGNEGTVATWLTLFASIAVVLLILGATWGDIMQFSHNPLAMIALVVLVVAAIIVLWFGILMLVALIVVALCNWGLNGLEMRQQPEDSEPDDAPENHGYTAHDQ